MPSAEPNMLSNFMMYVGQWVAFFISVIFFVKAITMWWYMRSDSVLSRNCLGYTRVLNLADPAVCEIVLERGYIIIIFYNNLFF